ncbi:MAG: glycosyltransferase [Clostridia bacterium]|nr:glycosyltransferase [Clostridia bacterium]
MSKIIIYTRSGKTSPSSNYRILQYADALNGDIECRPLTSDKLYKMHGAVKNKWSKLINYSLFYGAIQFNAFRYMLKDIHSLPDCIIVQRAICPKIILSINKILMKKVIQKVTKLIWDFDDEIIKCGEITKFELDLLQKYSTNIVVTGEILCSKLCEEAQKRTTLMPTTDAEFENFDIQKAISLRKETFDTQIELLWLATAPSMSNLYMAAEKLDKAAGAIKDIYHKRVILHVVCNKPFEYEAKNFEIDNITWTRERAAEMLLKSHIGIMPLENNEINRGKGGFKIIQYMSVGMPAVASDVGYNHQVIDQGKTGYLVKETSDPEGWGKSLLELSANIDKYIEFCYSSRKRWDEKFSSKKNLETWNKLIHNI